MLTIGLTNGSVAGSSSVVVSLLVAYAFSSASASGSLGRCVVVAIVLLEPVAAVVLSC